MDLSNYVRVGIYDLPEPTRTSAPSGNLLAQEASGVTYNWDTNTLFIVGDGGTSVTQVSLTGQLIDTMTLAQNPSHPQGVEFYDTESITYVGGGQFVFTEERWRQIDLLTYSAGATLARANVKTVDLGTDIGNIGLEGVTYDPHSGGFILVKEKDAEGVFQTTVDFNAGTASNGSPTTTDSVNLFNPANVGTTDFSDVYALSSNPSFVGTTEEGNILILSQESGRIVELDRAGNVLSHLDLVAPATSTGIDLQAMTVEGMTMGPDGKIYLVSEEGGGDFDHPSLWVYAPSTATNEAPTAIALVGPTASILENTDTTSRVKVAGINVTDDGAGTNSFSVSGADAKYFEADATGLYIKAGAVLDYETKTSYSVTVNVDDTSVGSTPDASINYALAVTNVVNEGGATGGVIITEVAPWSSGNSPSTLASDWFELTNESSGAIDLTGWKMDDNSYAFASAVAMSGVTSLAAGESAIFIEVSGSQTAAGEIAAFRSLWNVADSVQIGAYSGSGVGLGAGGDAVNVFSKDGALQASVTFGSSPGAAPFATFDNAAGLNSTSTTTHVTISAQSAVGTNGAYAINPSTGQEIGSPGTIGGVAAPVNHAPTALGLSGEITSLAENASTASHVKVADVVITDDGLGTNTLSLSGADAKYFEVDATGLYIKAGTVLDYETQSHYAVTIDVDDTTVGATPDASVGFALDLTDVVEATARITEVAPWSSGNSPVAADWFEVTNTGSTTLDMTGWKMDDNSNSFANAVALSGVTSLAAGESAIFLEVGGGQTAAGLATSFINTWFGGNAPVGLQIGSYTGSGVGLSTGGDAVNLFNAAGVLQANVTFGSSPAGPFGTFDNTAGANNIAITTTSAVGTNAAFAAANDGAEIGSPGETVHTNDAPVAVNDAKSGLVEDSVSSASGNVLTNDHDADKVQTTTEVLSVSGVRAGAEAAGGSLTAVSGATVAHGVYGDLTINADGSYSYALSNSSAAVQNLNQGDTAHDVFTYQVSDAHGAADTAQLDVSIAGANDGFTLQLLAFMDEEGGAETPQTAYRLAGLVEGFQHQVANTLILSGGDTYIPGPFASAGTDNSIGAVVPGAANNSFRPDVAILNAIGISAAAIGNHEFDLGSNTFQAAITPGSGWAGALYPYLSANLNTSADTFLNPRYVNTLTTPGLDSAASLAGKIAPSAVVQIGGENIGLIGLTPQNLKFLSSPTGSVISGDPNGEINVALAAQQVQAVVDDLTAHGVNKIVLTTDSNNIAFDKAVVELVRGVDLVVAGGSHNQLGDADDVPLPGQNFTDALPVVTHDADGNTVLLVSTDEEYTYLDRLVVKFDNDGHIDPRSLDTTVNGAYASTDANVADAWGVDEGDLGSTAYTSGTKAAAVKTITDAIESVIVAKDGNVLGYSDVYLEGQRVQVRAQETNLGDLSADANADAARHALGLSATDAVVSVKNGGGIRSAIGHIGDDGAPGPTEANVDAGKPAGGVSQLDIENALRFDNKLMTFDTTAQGLLNILNSPNTVVKNNGGFIQIGGVEFSYDPTKPAGSRVQDVALVNDLGEKVAIIADNGVVVAGAPSIIHGVVLNFTAQGGDSYAFKANADNFRYLLADGTVSAAVDESLDFTSATTISAYAGSTPLLGEQKVFEDYMTSHYGTPEAAYNQADTPEAQDLRIQNQAVRVDTVLSGPFVTYGTNGADTMIGTTGDDVLKGGAGKDTINGGAGDDIISGGAGADKMAGGDGVDTLSYDNAPSAVVVDMAAHKGSYGEGIGDTFSGFENLTGSAHDDALYGDKFDNVINGGAGNDHIEGQNGDDTLIGGEGNDELVGGKGLDTLTGGAGDDVFIFAKGDTGKTDALADVITDFVSSHDRIDLSDIDASTKTPAVMEHFTFIGTNTFHKVAGELRYEHAGTDVIVSGDWDGNGKADFMIHLNDVASLTSADFIL